MIVISNVLRGLSACCWNVNELLGSSVEKRRQHYRISGIDTGCALGYLMTFLP